MGTSGAEAPAVEVRLAVNVTSELELGGGAAATFETADARGDAPALETQASVLHGDRSARASAGRGGEGTAALSGGESDGPEDGGGARRPLGRQTHEPQREGALAEVDDIMRNGIVIASCRPTATAAASPVGFGVAAA